MRLAFVSFHYFPYGGLERDMLAMAELCQQRGHDVKIYTAIWEGAKPAHLHIEVLGISRQMSNHRHDAIFIKAVQAKLAEEPDRVVIGLKKMPGLDFYYAADSCFAAKAYGQRGWLYRATKRARQQLAMEKTVFGADSRTHCFMISRQEMDVYQRYYQTPNARLHLLPPGIRRDRVMPEDYNSQRQQLRHAFGISSDQKLVLMVGSNFKLKGVDLAIRALAELPSPLAQQTHLWVAGQDNPAAFERLAKKLKIGERVRMLGARNDISQLMWAADALVHPAHRENTGTVLLEAMVAGLPVIASRTCGYASYIEEHEIGRVLAAPITGSSLAHALASVLTEPHQQWVEKGRLFASEDIFAMTERAAELIEQLGGES